MRKIIAGVVASIIGVAIGWNLRQINRAQPVVDEQRGRSIVQSEKVDDPTDANGNSIAPIPSIDEVCTATGAEGTRLLVRYLAEADLASIQELLTALSDRSHWSVRDFGDLICLRAVELDPPGFIAWLSTGKNRQLFQRLRWLTYRAWAKLDRESAIVACSAETDDFRRTVIADLEDSEVDAVLVVVREHWKDSPFLPELERRRKRALARTHPQLALAEAEQIPSGVARRNAIRDVFESWASADPEAAWLRLQSKDEASDKPELAMTMAGLLAKKDAGSAIQKLSTLPRNETRLRTEGTIVSQWAKQDLESAVRWVLDEPNANHRASLFAEVAGELAKLDPHRLMQTVQDLPMNPARVRGYLDSNGLTDAIQLAAAEIAKDDPRQALSYLGLARITRGYGIETIATRWATQEPAVASEWAVALPNGPFRSAMLEPMMETWGATDPVAAAAFLGQNDTGKMKGALASKVTETWVKQDMPAALQWAAGIDDNAASAAVGQAARVDPLATASFVEALEDSKIRIAASGSLAQAWRSSEPAAAMEWLRLQIDRGEEELATRLEYNTQAWARETPAAVSEWLGQMPDGMARDHASAGMAEILVNGEQAQRDYEAATLLVESIGDPKLREKWLGRIRKNLEKELSEQSQ